MAWIMTVRQHLTFIKRKVLSYSYVWHNYSQEVINPYIIKLEGKNYQALDKGYCDILVRDESKDKEEFLIIECKTADLSKKTDEFRKHWTRTLQNGDQLFRYFNTYRKAKYLCLFSADYPEYTEGGIKKHRFENIYIGLKIYIMLFGSSDKRVGKVSIRIADLCDFAQGWKTRY